MNTRGFTLFFAVLVASLALSVGLTIYDLTARELNLSSTVEQSQYAIYAADTGVECVLYWDSKYVDSGSNNNGGSSSAFSTSTLDTLAPGGGSGLDCGGLDITSAAATGWSVAANASAATTTFALTFLPQPYCVLVTVAKNANGNSTNTTITSYGFNNGTGANCAPTSVLQLERTLEVNY